MENYENKYKEALELARDYHKANLKLDKEDENLILEDIFPELAESEDEKIRKELIEHIKANKWADYVLFQKFSPDDVIAWLEKQESVEEIVERCKKSWYNEGKIAGMAEGLTDDEKYQQGWHDAVEKQVPIDRDKVVKGVRRGVATSLINYIDANSKGMCLSNMECEDIDDAIVDGKWYKVYAYMKKKLEKQGEPSDKGEISDGYHTFNELYCYRMLYNAAFFNMLPKEWVHKSKKHNDGEECFGGGWFIVMANLPTGQISNHYELKDWDLFQIPEKERADKWDGHTPQEAAERLHNFLLKKQGEKPQGKTALEAIKEKPVDKANKVEPKFKVGDWIVEPRKGEHNCIWHIDRIEKNSYWEGHTGVFIEHADKYYHLWTIKDAKDGDVLYSLDSNQPFIYKERNIHEQATAYCGINKYGKFFVWNTKDCIITLDKYIPATKEQRDTLMNAMTKAGWQFNFDKKELKKIEQNCNWSKEDEQILLGVIDELKANKSESPEYDYDTYDRFIDWLESLRHKNGWKPSDEQMS